MDRVELVKVDEVHFQVNAERGILQEMAEEFSFFIENHWFDPRVKARAWDGKIRLLNMRHRTIYVGLLKRIGKFCKDRGYHLKWDYSDLSGDELSESQAKDFVEEVLSGATDRLEVRDYQIDTFTHCVRNTRALFVSPTSSGKSLMIYLLIRYYLEEHGCPALVIVDSTAAVKQMHDDFVSYGHSPSEIGQIFSGQKKDGKQKIVISTFHSLLKMPDEWFDRFGTLIGDEAHHYKAKALTGLVERIRHAKYRFGFTGTLDGIPTNKMILEGLFGPVEQFVTTKELQEQGYVAQLDIKCIVLQYPDEQKKSMAAATYQKETDFLVAHPARNRFIKNLVGSLDGNTLVFYNYVEKHGEVLYNLIKESYPDKQVHFIHGGVKGEIRNDVRKVFEENDNVIAVCSYGTFQTAISIKNIFNLVFAWPSKSRIRNLQSIGRGLRMNERKKSVTLYDIADNLIHKTWKNHTIKHFGARLKTYSEERFEPKIYNVKLKDD